MEHVVIPHESEPSISAAVLFGSGTQCTSGPEAVELACWKCGRRADDGTAWQIQILEIVEDLQLHAVLESSVCSV